MTAFLVHRRDLCINTVSTDYVMSLSMMSCMSIVSRVMMIIYIGKEPGYDASLEGVQPTISAQENVAIGLIDDGDNPFLEAYSRGIQPARDMSIDWSMEGMCYYYPLYSITPYGTLVRTE